MNLLTDTEPKAVFRLFEAICDLPHGSRNTKLISDFCVVYARVRGLDVTQDKANNVVIRVPASQGYEDHPTVVFQGHLDMVTERAQDCEVDFAHDGLTLKSDGDTLRAEGTTLGADDGIAVAFALALADDKNLVHPPLEILLTADEEIGMLGAEALDPSAVSGRVLLNLDSDTEGVLTVGCAGGVRSSVSLPIGREPAHGIPYTLGVQDLTGGHSGTEIGMGRPNAIREIAAIFAKLVAARGDIRLISFVGGGKDNAIPRDASIRFLTKEPVGESLNPILQASLDALREKDPSALITLSEGNETDISVLKDESRDAILSFVSTAPDGVQTRDGDTVMSSLNLGIARTDKTFACTWLVRGQTDAGIAAVTGKLKEAVKTAGGQYTESNAYPAWESRSDSRLRAVMVETYRRLYDYEPRVETVHAGLECGVLAKKLKGLDCVSFGPDIHGCHTPKETLSVSSVARTWNYLLEILKSL